MSKRHFFPILGPPKRIFKFHPLFVHPRPWKTWKPQHPEGFSKRSAAPARPRVAKARISYHQATASPDLRADAPRRLRRISRPSISSQCGLESFWMGTCFRNIFQQRLKDHIDELCVSRPDRLIWCFLTSQGHAIQDCNLPAKNIHFPILPSDAAKSSNMYKHLSETWWHSKQTWLLEPRSLEPALLAGSGAAQSSSIHACGHIWGLGRLSTKHTDTHTQIYMYI